MPVQLDGLGRYGPRRLFRLGANTFPHLRVRHLQRVVTRLLLADFHPLGRCPRIVQPNCTRALSTTPLVELSSMMSIGPMRHGTSMSLMSTAATTIQNPGTIRLNQEAKALIYTFSDCNGSDIYEILFLPTPLRQPDS